MHKISIKTALLVMTVLVTLVSMLLFNAVYGNLTGEAFTQMDLKLVTQNLGQAKDKLDEAVKGAVELSSWAAQSVLMRQDFSPARFSASLDPLVKIDGQISSAVLYNMTGTPVCATSKDGGSFLPGQNPYAEDWFQQTLKQNDLCFSGARLEHSYRGDYTWVVTVARPVSYLKDEEPLQGILAVNLRLSAIKRICDAYSSAAGGALMLTDTEGNVIYSPRTKVLNLKNLSDVYVSVGVRPEESKQLEISQPLANERWILVGQTMEAESMLSRQSLRLKGMLVFVLSLLLASLMAYAMAVWMARPFRYMERTMERIDAGVSGVRLQIHGFKEFVNLSVKYNVMIDEIERLMAETERKQEQLLRMEVASLEAQINPHFLYNTLDSITWLVETGRGPDAVKMIGALAALLRLSINRGGNFHTVGREVEHIRNYLIIQKARYGQRFQSHIHVEKDAEDLLCPRLILQPIVENAIKHGIGDNTDCQVVVRVFLEGGRLMMTVWDDGMGILPDKLREVQRALKESEAPRRDEINGLALKSVNRRIRLLCGEEYGLNIESETEEWTCVTIALPLRSCA